MKGDCRLACRRVAITLPVAVGARGAAIDRPWARRLAPLTPYGGVALLNLRSRATSRPVLRLVGEQAAATGSEYPAWAGQPGLRAEESRRSQVRRENHAASLRFDLDPNDPRWVLATEARIALQGATLTADRRQRLLGLAHQLGMRPFDANLVIAIVQDEARSGSAAPPLAGRLRIIPARGDATPAATARPAICPTGLRAGESAGRSGLSLLFLSVLVAGGVLALLICWLLDT